MEIIASKNRTLWKQKNCMQIRVKTDPVETSKQAASDHYFPFSLLVFQKGGGHKCNNRQNKERLFKDQHISWIASEVGECVDHKLKDRAYIDRKGNSPQGNPYTAEDMCKVKCKLV